MMRLVPLLLLCGMTSILQAQIVDDYQPDSDGDGCIAMSDLLSLLSVFGSCEVQAFACGDPVGYQDHDYATVLIGEQCWFAENLRSENYENGDPIPTGLNTGDEWEFTTAGATTVFGLDSPFDDCLIDNDACSACEPAWALQEYGRLYNWYAVDDARGLCPSGWHVPTNNEWTLMTDHLGGGTVAADMMKMNYGWIYGGGNGTNASGFSGLPGGFRHSDGYYYGAGNAGSWWTSSPKDIFDDQIVTAWSFDLGGGTSDDGVPQSGRSIRCIQD